jgi:hypothetical protein
MEPSSQDRKIREKLAEMDRDLQDQLKDEMKQEEENVRGYFKEFQKPVSEDPTVVSKWRGIQKSLRWRPVKCSLSKLHSPSSCSIVRTCSGP